MYCWAVESAEACEVMDHVVLICWWASVSMLKEGPSVLFFFWTGDHQYMIQVVFFCKAKRVIFSYFIWKCIKRIDRPKRESAKIRYTCTNITIEHKHIVHPDQLGHPHEAHTRCRERPSSSLLHEPTTPTSPSTSTNGTFVATDTWIHVGPWQKVDPRPTSRKRRL